MRVKSQLFLVFFFILIQAKSQNLVPNPSFENSFNLPCSWIVPPSSNFSASMSDWIMPTAGSSDIYSTLNPPSCYASCFSTDPSAQGSQAPRTGTTMCGFCAYGSGGDPIYREYLEVKLTSPLVPGKKYYAEMYVSVAELIQYGCNNLGMYFSTTLIADPVSMTTLNYTPQIKSTTIITDATNWVKISGTFTATTAAEYLTIGNFNNNFDTQVTQINSTPVFNNAYYYIDDVLVKDLCGATDTSATICVGNSIKLDRHDNTITSWALASSPTTILSHTSTVTVSPLVNTKYIATYACGETSTYEVIVVATPEVVTASINDPGWSCENTLYSFTATANTTGTGTLHYQWSITDASGNVTPDGVDSPNYFYRPTLSNNGQKVKVVVTTSSSCNTGPATSNTVTFDLKEYLWPSVSITASNNPQCGTAPTTFTLTSTAGGTAPGYRWILIPVNSSTEQIVATDVTTYTSATLSDGDQIYVAMSSNYPCALANNPIKSNIITLDITPQPTPTIQETDQTICSPNTFTFHGVVGTGTSLTWKLNNRSITPNGNRSTFKASQSGVYTLYEANGSCSATSAPVTLTVIPTPVANAGTDIYTNIGSTGNLNGSGGTVYNWSPGTNLSSTVISNPAYTATQTITYTLTVSDPSNMCSSTDDVTVFIIKPIIVPNVITVNGDGVNDDWQIENIEGYPNILIEIYNRWGGLVWQTKGYSKRWNGTNFRNGQVLPEGTYFYVINPNSTVYNEPRSGWVQIIK